MSFVCILMFAFVLFFFFKQKTAYEMRISDWSSDVCSSDLTLIAAGPGRMRGGINIQCHRVAFLAPGGASLERRAIGHLDRDEVIIGMRVLFHMSAPVTAGFRPAWMREFQ